MKNIPTPESDEVFGPRVTGFRSNKCRDLERRLTVAREALMKLDNDIMRYAQRAMIIRETLKQTAPKL